MLDLKPYQNLLTHSDKVVHLPPDDLGALIGEIMELREVLVACLPLASNVVNQAIAKVEQPGGIGGKLPHLDRLLHYIDRGDRLLEGKVK